MTTIKKALTRVVSAFTDMGGVSKTILRITSTLFFLLCVPSVTGIVLFAATPNPDLVFLCEKAIETSGQIIVLGFIGAIVMDATFHK